MANWISSKLKAAETILQQIDQQAAESLRKDEKSETHEEVFETSSKSSSPVSLKDKLRKKTYDGGSDSGGASQRNSTEQKPSYLRSSKNLRKPDQSRERTTSSPSQSLTQEKPTLTDADWTELLSAPSNQGTSTSKPRTPRGTSVIRGLKKDGKRQGSGTKSPLVSDAKKNEKGSGNVVDSRGKSQKQPNKEPRDKEVSSPSDADMENKNVSQDIFVKTTHKESEKDVNAKPPSLDESTRSAKETLPRETLPNAGKLDGREPRRSDVWGKQVRGEILRSNNVSDGLKRKDSSLSSDESESDYESDSSTDSERERQREERRRRREKIFAEKVAAKAVAVIKERENMVARLEGEKQSLEKIVEERAKQQAQEAAELQTNMMETLEAADLEKQKHNNTRMEVFSRLAGLEAANAELTRSLAAGQKKLEAQIDQVAVLREQVELKESALEGLKRKSSNIRGSGNLVNKLDASRGDMFEHQMLEAEISLLTDKIGWLQDKANKLEADINTMRKELEEPTEVEIELKRRLDQLTDHLIQKQSQVEALSSEKATISFRIEAVSRLIEENKGMSATEASSQDLEAGEWQLSGSKFKPAFQDKIRSGKKHLGWLVMQLNAIFVSGTVFLRRNPTAKIWALVYLVCLHLWVLYILLSHSSDSSSSELRSGAVISLENFNNSSLQ